MSKLRPTDLAREHGLSTQAVRNYERDGFIPPAERTPSGYRIYTRTHAVALRAYLALVPAYYHFASGQIMNLIHNGDIDGALAAIDRGHLQLVRDRRTLDAVEQAVEHLLSHTDSPPDQVGGNETRTVGELAYHLDVTPATLRNWEVAGVLTPQREPATGYRVYRAGDVRDAELAHLLRRGGYSLEHICLVVQQIRGAGDTDALAASLTDWRRRLTGRGRAMLTAAARLHDYLDLTESGQNSHAAHE